MTIHLIESTIVLAAALIISRAPRLSAASRHAVVFAALLKFALPSALITMIIERLAVAPASGSFALIHRVDHAIAAAEPASSWPIVLRVVWLLIAAVLVLRAFVINHRVTRLALSDVTQASPREHTALAMAGDGGIKLVRSSFASAPAAIGLFRTTIILPANGCDALDDAELTSILMHECAHVSRRDNLLGAIEALIGSALWFHPLVWLARRDLALRREQACDEIAARGSASAYLNALRKLGRAAIAPRAATVACMASTQLNERMNRLMSLSSTRRFLPHRLVASLAVLLIATFTIAAAAAHATTPPKQYTGEKITMTLKDADIHDVMGTFSQLTGTKIVIDTATNEKVTVDLKDVPWDEAFDRIVSDAGLKWSIADGTIHVTK